ncbi:phBC6A51 family helix-turn-helix protein [Heyndrickxia coagulans]|uniref:phBC6A51 family helix-turn-helix protein n=1 Tax=Heyndrickxia coagulans TaxID=1398 RepID=UPI000779C047|nr:phBC6A51 family helix-turn-helix protein [Heyndrickxia coagulans]
MPRKKKRSKQPSQVPPLDARHFLAMDLMVRPYYDGRLGRNRRLTRQEIADMIGISRMQLYRWEQRKDFQREKDKRLRAYVRSIVPKNRKSYADLAVAGDAKAFADIVKALDIR